MRCAQSILDCWRQTLRLLILHLKALYFVCCKQEVAVAKEEEKDLNKLYYMPAQADRCSPFCKVPLHTSLFWFSLKVLWVGENLMLSSSLEGSEVVTDVSVL